jgi:hypothetical protein
MRGLSQPTESEEFVYKRGEVNARDLEESGSVNGEDVTDAPYPVKAIL